MFRAFRSRRDKRAEVESHIRLEADQLEAEGLSPDQALAQARARFGYTAHLDNAGSFYIPGWAEVAWRDTRQAARQLIQTPVSTLTILASLIIGIGINTAVFSLADQVLVKALPVESPDEIVQLSWEGEFIGGGRGWGSLLPHALYLDLRADQELFADVAARSPGEITAVTGQGSERLHVELVTGSYFPMLGIRPELGRVFTADDDLVPDDHAVVILSHEYWQSRFGGDPDVVGKELRVNMRPFEIVGVAPAGFHGTDWSMAPSLWLPMMMNDHVHEWGDLEESRVRFQHVYGRLAPGVTADDAQRRLQPWFQRYLRTDMERDDWPADVDESRVDAYLASTLAVDAGGQGQAARETLLKQPILILTAATALVLLLACLNVANLSLAKAVARRGETAVRVALGASRRRIVLERLAEAGLLAFIGSIAGVLMAPLVGRWILSYLQAGSGFPMALSAAIDSRALGLAMVIAIIATLVSGVGPAWFAASTPPMGAMRTGTRSVTGGLALRRLLVTGQVALALVFLVAAGLFGTTLRSLKLQGPGFGTDNLMTFTITPANDGYETMESKQALQNILTELQNLPAVSEAGVGVWPILAGGGWGNPVLIDGATRRTTEDGLPMNAVSPGFFAALGVPVVLGRDFNEADRYDEPGWYIRSALVSESFVERYLPDENPLGVRIDFGSRG